MAEYAAKFFGSALKAVLLRSTETLTKKAFGPVGRSQCVVMTSQSDTGGAVSYVVGSLISSSVAETVKPAINTTIGKILNRGDAQHSTESIEQSPGEDAPAEDSVPSSAPAEPTQKKSLMQASHEYFAVQKFYLRKVLWLLALIVLLNIPVVFTVCFRVSKWAVATHEFVAIQFEIGSSAAMMVVATAVTNLLLSVGVLAVQHGSPTSFGVSRDCVAVASLVCG